MSFRGAAFARHYGPGAGRTRSCAAVLPRRAGSLQSMAGLADEGPCEFVALQPVAVVDHLCTVDAGMLQKLISDGCARTRQAWDPCRCTALVARLNAAG